MTSSSRMSDLENSTADLVIQGCFEVVQLSVLFHFPEDRLGFLCVQSIVRVLQEVSKFWSCPRVEQILQVLLLRRSIDGADTVSEKVLVHLEEHLSRKQRRVFR